MEEKILIKSESYSIKRTVFLGLLIMIIGFFLIHMIVSFLPDFLEYYDIYSSYRNCKCWYVTEEYMCDIHKSFSSGFAYAWSVTSHTFNFVFSTTLAVALLLTLILGLVYLWLRSFEINVTNKRVYGKTSFGRRVDLPIDSISAIGTSWLKGITIATSSGKIAFLMIKNRDEIHKCVSDLLIERQSKPTSTATPVFNQEAPISNAEELKKYKELLDMGVITQEEFDAKKKQLLGL